MITNKYVCSHRYRERSNIRLRFWKNFLGCWVIQNGKQTLRLNCFYTDICVTYNMCGVWCVVVSTVQLCVTLSHLTYFWLSWFTNWSNGLIDELTYYYSTLTHSNVSITSWHLWIFLMLDVNFWILMTWPSY